MSEETSVPVEVVKPSRYKTSRKGMGGRKRKYGNDKLTAVVDVVKAGSSLSKACKTLNHPYVSIRSALIREKMWPIVVVTGDRL